MEKILISHNDLDGVSCGVIAHSVYGSSMAKYFCAIKGIDEKIIEILKKNADVKLLYITDITPKAQSTLDYIGELGVEAYLYDHHETEKDRYKKLHVPGNMTCEFDMHRCGTKILYDNVCNSNALGKFAATVDDYDRFQLKIENSVKLNQLFNLYGEQGFINRCNTLTGDISEFSPVERAYLECIAMENSKYVQDKIDSIKSIEVMGKTVALIYGDRLVSMIAKRMRKDKLKYDYVAMVMGDTVSLRSISDNSHCGKFARQFSKLGGGHAGAGGFQISATTQETLIKLIFSSQN